MDKAEFYRNARHDLTGPLDGVRVIDTTTAWAGPMASCVLADLGCDVIRIDLPGPLGHETPPFIGGTGLSFVPQTVNRNKRSVTMDLRTEEGRESYLRLVETADIVVENFKPGTLAGWGVGYEDCRAVKEDIVYVSVSGYGQFGPWSERPGYDPAALAASGWMSLNGDVDGGATKAPTFLCDDLAGLHGALGGLAALRHRDQTGEGQHVDVSLLDAILFQSDGFLSLGATDVEQPRWGNQVGVCAPCNTYRCLDGEVYMAVVLNSHWRLLARLMGRVDLVDAAGFATNNERIENREAVDKTVADWCAGLPVSEVVDPLTDAGIVVAKVNTFAEAARVPHILERDMLQPTTLANGTQAPIVGPAAKFSRTPTRVRNGAPAPGAHNAEVLGEAGAG